MNTVAKVISKVNSIFARMKVPAEILTRVSIGTIFVQTGWGKLQHLDRTIEFFSSLGIPAPQIQAPFAAATEFLCAIFLFLGFATRISAFLLMIIMVVALKTAKADEITDVDSLFRSMEFLILGMLFWLVAYGAGKHSLDQLFRKKFKPTLDLR